MPVDLACLLSYGLLCTPVEVPVVEVPPADPLVTAVVDPVPELPAGESGKASLVLARVQGYYDGTRDLETKFKQTYVHPVYGTKKESSGTLRARKPGLMVWDYDNPQSADYWIEEGLLHVVEHATHQVIRQSLANSDIAGAEQFLFGGKALTEDFQVKLAGTKLERRYGQPEHTSIRLRPRKKNPHYKELMLVVDDATGRVDAFVVLGQDQSTNHFELQGWTRNIGLSDEALKFHRPAGYKQITGN